MPARGQVVKSDSATVRVPELDFEIPADTQRGSITTVEGLLRDASDALRALQPERKAAAPAQVRQSARAMYPLTFARTKARAPGGRPRAGARLPTGTCALPQNYLSP